MTHIPGIPVSGEITFGKTYSDRPCEKCSGRVFYEVWESSDGGWEDYRYTCESCHHRYWIDGIDS